MNLMKKILAGMAALIATVSCADKTPQVLILYYSQTSNTATVAEEIFSMIHADSEEIVPQEPYDGDFRQTIERCLKEREEGTVPEIQPISSDLSDYDILFLGYPVWFGTYAPPIAGLLKSVNLDGKKIVPFCTFGSGGLDSSVRDLREQLPNAEILPGYGVRAARLAAAHRELERFLKANGFIEGESEAPEEFPDPHPVTEEEAAIFDAAVDGYPMLNAQATAVASRAVPDGTEYLFTAADRPREQGPDVPPAGELKVYVLVEPGQVPVFTQVVR